MDLKIATRPQLQSKSKQMTDKQNQLVEGPSRRIALKKVQWGKTENIDWED
jgi:hypothetical protein